MYSLLRKILFLFSPEHAHTIALKTLTLTSRLRLSRFLTRQLHHPVTVMGLSFPNPIGVAAGLDKNADYVDALASLGFGFIEIGTVTPKTQIGNPKPRLFRLIKEKAIINRMGFNNKGVEYVARKLEKIRYRGVLGVNIGKNKDTPNDKAVDDYLFCFRALWKYASYVTINISSPNTTGLRELQQADSLSTLLAALKQEQQAILLEHKRYIPLVVKIAPDLSTDALTEMANVFLAQKIDGVIATNTTIERDGVVGNQFANETGGLSGAPLQMRSTEVVAKLHALLQDRVPIIASGGVMNADSVSEKLSAGASLVQVYTGFIYGGPAWIGSLM